MFSAGVMYYLAQISDVVFPHSIDFWFLVSSSLLLIITSIGILKRSALMAKLMMLTWAAQVLFMTVAAFITYDKFGFVTPFGLLAFLLLVTVFVFRILFSDNVRSQLNPSKT